MKIRKSGGGDYLMIIIGLIIGLPILIISIVFSDFNRDIETIGTVTRRGIYYHNENSNHTTYTISAIYDCGSKKGIEGDNIGSVSQYYEIGEKITLYCDENEPQLFTFNKPFDEFLIHVLGGLAFGMPWFILSLIGIIRVIKQNKRKKLKKELKHVGTKVEATIVDINQTENQSETSIISQIIGQNLGFRDTNKNARFDGKLGFQVTAQYGEDIFISENIYADIYYALDIGDKIDLYIDETDYSKFFIDIDSILEKDYKVPKMDTNKNGGELIIYGMIAFIMSILFIYESGFDFNNLFIFIIAVFLIGFGVKRKIKQRNRKILNQKLKQFGKKVEARVLLVLEMTDTSKSKWRILVNKYRIIAKYNKETFLSDIYPGNLNNLVKKGDKIDIYLDDSDHSKYYMVLPKKKIR